MITRRYRKALSAVLGLAMAIAACQQEAIEANKRQVQAAQAQIEQLQKEIEALKSQQNYGASSFAPGTPGTCDREVMKTAMQRGSDASASGNIDRALGYYKDALTACPGNPEAELSLARTYEAAGDRKQAIAHYRAAADSKDSNSSTAREARAALSRLSSTY